MKSLHIPVVTRTHGVAGTWIGMITSSWFIMVGHLGEVGYPMMGADLAYTGYLVWRHNFHNGEPLAIGKSAPKIIEPARKPVMWPPVDTHCYVCGMEDVGGQRMEVFKTADHPSCMEWLGDWKPPVPHFGPDMVTNLPRQTTTAPQWRIYSKHSAQTAYRVDGVLVNERKAEVVMSGDTPVDVIMTAYGGDIGYKYAQRGMEVVALDGAPEWLEPKPGGPHKGIVAAGEWQPVKECSCRACEGARRRDAARQLRNGIAATTARLDANERRLSDLTDQLQRTLARALFPAPKLPGFRPTGNSRIHQGHLPYTRTREWSPVEGCECLPCKYATNWRNR